MAAARKAKKKPPAKPSTKKPTATGKNVSKVSKSTKPRVASKKVTVRKKPKSKSARNSVDSILTTFDKQRTELESKLATVRKKIAQLEAKTKAFQAEIVSLKEAEAKAETTIGTLDGDRDQAVRGLLDKLGVKLVVETAAKSNAKKSSKSKTRKTKKKASKPKASKKTRDVKASTSADGPAVIQATPLFDSVIAAPTANENSPVPELPPSPSSDELLDDRE